MGFNQRPLETTALPRRQSAEKCQSIGLMKRRLRLGVQRDPWEGPSDFASRAALLLPNESERIRQISNTYIALRYAPEPADVALDGFAKEVRAFAVRR